MYVPPSIFYIVLLTNNYTIEIGNLKDPSGVASVKFPTWTSKNGQDDLKWHEGTYLGNGTWRVVINKSEHKNESGEYITHIYGYDGAGNRKLLKEVKTTMN